MGDSRYRSEAWAVFVRRYTRLFFDWFKHWGVDPHSMEDVFQESMMRVLEDISSFHHQREGSFRAWLRILAYSSWRQLVADTRRQLALREAEPLRATSWRLISSKLAEDHLLELFDSWATEEVLNLAVNRARKRSSPEVWETYERISIMNEPVAQVAIVMKIPTLQVYNRVAKVRKHIRQELDKAEGLDP